MDTPYSGSVVSESGTLELTVHEGLLHPHTRLCDAAVELTEFGLFIHVHKCRAIIVLTVVISQCDVDRCCVFDATVMRS